MSRYEDLVMAAEPASYWLAASPSPRDPLTMGTVCDLAVIGGGFSGLWTALLAKERHPNRTVVLLEGNRVGWAASGRNGGFCEASLTHGEANGRERFPAEFDVLQRFGAENLDAIEATVRKYGIDCDFERTGQLQVATEEYQVGDLRSAAEGQFFDAKAIHAEVNSPPTWQACGTRRAAPCCTRPSNQFHDYRLTADNRILFGGYDAIYHFGRAIRSSYD
jgi:hypothetical protein